jgi:hypothetical protein
VYVKSERSAIVIRSAGRAGEAVANAVYEALHRAGIEDVKATSELIHSDPLMISAVVATIERVDLIVADVSSVNPNVMFELGYALALKKPLILLVSTAAANHLPIDISGLWYLTYNPGNLRALTVRLERAVQVYMAEGTL